jgi:WD40 repeat protein
VGAEDGKVQLLSTKGLSLIRSLETRREEYTLLFSPDSRSLAITTHDHDRGIIHVYTVPDLELQRTVQSGTKGAVLGSYFGADGRSLVMVEASGTMNVWRAGQEDAMVRSVELPDEVWSLCRSPDMQRLVVGSGKTLKQRDKRLKFKGRVYLYDLDGLEEPRSFLAHSHFVIAVTSSTKGDLLASAAVSQIKLWDYPSLLRQN